jgi:hypothetical protein
VLLTDQAIAKLITRLESKIADLKLQLERQRRGAEAMIAAETKVCETRLEAESAKTEAWAKGFAAERSLYDSALKKAQAPSPWYKAPYLHFIFGSVVSGGICAAATVGARQ